VADYTVKIDGANGGTDWTFSVPPELEIDARRVHRADVAPEACVVIEYTVRLPRCRVYSSDGTPDKAQERFGEFLAAVAHHRVKPTFVQILDSAGAPIDGVGDMNTATTGWEEILITEFSVPGGPAQFRAGVEFSLTITARRVFPDANNLVEFERSYRSEIGPDRLERRRIECRARMKAGTAVPLTASWFTTLAKTTQPERWMRTVGGTSGIQATYPLGAARTDVVETVSEVRQVGGTRSPPTGAGDFGFGETRRDRPELGLVEVTTFAEATGATSGDAFLRSAAPAAGVGERTHDEARRLARGQWVTFELAGTALGGKVSRVVVSRQFQVGGAVVRVARRSGNLLPAVRKGALSEWRLVERVEVFALGVKAWDDIPTLPLLPAPWVHDPERSGEDAPEIVEPRAPTVDQTLWRRVSTRAYVWDGSEASPLDDEAVTRALVRRYEPGEEGLTLT
jgi:hypothetical protein